MESWIQTYSGQAVDLLNPDPATILIEDIAHALAHSCRYAGHSKGFYSIAQHSVYVSRECSPRNALWGLLHDASEAYLCDIPAPLKQHLPDYRGFERRFERLIAEVFWLDPDEIPDEVHLVDKAMLRIEHRDVMGHYCRHWPADDLPALDLEIGGLWEPGFARERFLHTWSELTKNQTRKGEAA